MQLIHDEVVNCHIMKDYIEERVLELARYITETGATVRSAAARFRVSKSTVHKDITERLLEINKAQRHIRGGLATREKYLHQKSDSHNH